MNLELEELLRGEGGVVTGRAGAVAERASLRGLLRLRRRTSSIMPT